MPIKHAFTSAKSDGADSTLVRASNWNADHTIDSFALTGDISVTDIGPVNNWAPAGLGSASVIEWNGATAMTLTGLTGGADGRVIVLRNRNTGAGASLTLRNQDAASTAANRFFLPGSTDYVLPPQSAVLLQYSSSSAAWTLVATPASTSSLPTVGVGAPMRLLATKTTDQVNGTGGIAADTQLLLSVGANEVWRTEWWFLPTFTGGDFMTAWTFPSGGEVSMFGHILGPDYNHILIGQGNVSPTAYVQWISGTNIWPNVAHVMYKGGASAGTLGVNHYSTTGASYTMTRGSSLIGVRIA